MVLELRVSAEAPPGTIAQKARSLAAELDHAGLPTRPAGAATAAVARGGELLLGAFLIDHFAKPMVEKLAERLIGAVQRDRTLKVAIKRGDREITIDAKNMDRAEVEAFLRLADDTLG